MYYAWPTAISFSSGEMPTARAKTPETLGKKVLAEGGSRYFTALLVDGTWVDLTTYGPGNEDGREVSAERTARYVRARRRVLDRDGVPEVSQNTPIGTVEDTSAPTSPVPQASFDPSTGTEEGEQRGQVNLAINPAQVKAIYEFLAMDEKQREAAMNALSALSVSADAFKSAIAIMLEPDVDLVVSISEPKDD